MQSPLTTDLANAVILDARPAAEYAKGHVRGAVNADPDVHLSEPGDPARGGRHPLPPPGRWLEQLGRWGIGPETRVVVYDAQNGANAAARAWWMLRAIGHDNVFVLDGPLPEFTTDAPDVERGEPYPGPSSWQRPTVTIEEVDVLRNDPAWKILDVRSAPRYRGETEPIDPIAGHIPGAFNLPYSENLDSGRFKSPEVLREQYEHFLGGTSVEHLAVHCGSGITACHTLLALEHAGLHGASLFVGSWSEWCRTRGA